MTWNGSLVAPPDVAVARNDSAALRGDEARGQSHRHHTLQLSPCYENVAPGTTAPDVSLAMATSCRVSPTLLSVVEPLEERATEAMGGPSLSCRRSRRSRRPPLLPRAPRSLGRESEGARISGP